MKVLQVWNDIRASFWVNYPFKLFYFAANRSFCQLPPISKII